MKSKICTLLLLLILQAIELKSQEDQNLIPNPGFEQYHHLPTKTKQGLACAVSWRHPTLLGAGDYYHAASKTKKYRTGSNALGKQQPHTGQAFAGICVNKKFREFLQIQLLKPLEKDRTYRISLFISCADKIWLSKLDEFGIIFSKKAMLINGNDFLVDPPPVVFRDANKYKNKKDWIELSANYKATGNEKVMTFGSFLYREKIVVETREHGQIMGLVKYAHYYIDDVSIVPMDDGPPRKALAAGNRQEENVGASAFVPGKVYVFNSIQFETGKSELLPNAYPQLNELIYYMKKNSHVKILITGHTDNSGNTSDNTKLSYDRARAIELYLLSNEINRNNISIEGKGDQYPVDSNATNEGREKNRRVEISFF